MQYDVTAIAHGKRIRIHLRQTETQADELKLEALKWGYKDVKVEPHDPDRKPDEAHL